MSITRGVWPVLLSLSLVTVAAGCAATAPRSVTAVEVWRVGDDGLTLKFSEAVEAELRANASFVLSRGKKPGTLIVRIPSNVEWEPAGSDTRVKYEVAFETADSKHLRVKKGSCLESSLSQCAQEIVREAELVAATTR